MGPSEVSESEPMWKSSAHPWSELSLGSGVGSSAKVSESGSNLLV
jgi:hypothetical protein